MDGDCWCRFDLIVGGTTILTARRSDWCLIAYVTLIAIQTTAVYYLPAGERFPVIWYVDVGVIAVGGGGVVVTRYD